MADDKTEITEEEVEGFKGKLLPVFNSLTEGEWKAFQMMVAQEAQEATDEVSGFASGRGLSLGMETMQGLAGGSSADAGAAAAKPLSIFRKCSSGKVDCCPCW
jgi:hypothetical protein